MAKAEDQATRTRHQRDHNPIFCYERQQESIAHLTRTVPGNRNFRGVLYCPKTRGAAPYEAWITTYPNGVENEPLHQFIGRATTPHQAAMLYDKHVRDNNLPLKTNFGDV